MKTWWINRRSDNHAFLPECRSINQSNSYTAHEPMSDASPRMLASEPNAKRALTAWIQGIWHMHWEDGIDIYRSTPHRKNLPMETVEMTIQECLKGKPMVFVFGSNEQGIHGAGAALFARKTYGAQMGKGIGHYGNSYALPTKSTPARSLNLREIATHVGIFLAYARDHQEYSFKVTAVGFGLAGFKPDQIAPLFNGAPDNCYFDSSWKEFMIPETQYWGTV